MIRSRKFAMELLRDGFKYEQSSKYYSISKVLKVVKVMLRNVEKLLTKVKVSRMGTKTRLPRTYRQNKHFPHPKGIAHTE